LTFLWQKHGIIFVIFTFSLNFQLLDNLAMMERTTIKSIRKSTPYQFLFQSNPHLPGDAIVLLGGNYAVDPYNQSYEKGLEDGRKDMEAELIKRGKALYQLASQKIDSITDELVSESEAKGISIVEIHLKLEDWDCASSIIFVKLEDYLDEKIDFLYNKAHLVAQEINDSTFHWDYSITYYSDSVNKEKLIADGFRYIYEHTPSARQTQ
jgi:hypothetical protein